VREKNSKTWVRDAKERYKVGYAPSGVRRPFSPIIAWTVGLKGRYIIGKTRNINKNSRGIPSLNFFKVNATEIQVEII
jgi:hypothetical protein